MRYPLEQTRTKNIMKQNQAHTKVIKYDLSLYTQVFTLEQISMNSIHTLYLIFLHFSLLSFYNNSMKYDPTSEDSSRSATTEIPSPLWNLNVPLHPTSLSR
jgi:hypothetical protein